MHTYITYSHNSENSSIHSIIHFSIKSNWNEGMCYFYIPSIVNIQHIITSVLCCERGGLGKAVLIAVICTAEFKS